MTETPIYDVKCKEECEHYLGNWKCKAYPKGIPSIVFVIGHEKKREDQEGDYVFKPRKKKGK